MIFNRKKKKDEIFINDQKNLEANVEIEFYEKPKVCLFDLTDDVYETLTGNKYYCEKATLGTIIDIPNNKANDRHFVILNHYWPSNLHEYQVLVINLENNRHTPYDPEILIKKEVSGNTKKVLLSKYPATIFDPKPLSSRLLKFQIDELLKKQSIIIVFSSYSYQINYNFVNIDSDGYRTSGFEELSNYSFSSTIPYSTNKCGKIIEIAPNVKRFSNFLKKYLDKSSYSIVFTHPTHNEGGNQVKDNNFFPLLTNGDGDIVGYAFMKEESAFFLFPQIENKKDFICEFFTDHLSEIFTEIFPNAKHFAWIENKDYFLPHHQLLSEKRDMIEKEYSIKIEEINGLINDNKQLYSYLHDLLTQTDSLLVKAVERFFYYLGYEYIENVDENNPSLKEEDIRIKIDEGLLVIEIKGIGGTSTDADCSQISKIRHRRNEERGTFDVYGLYIVNHQRHIPPKKRKNPPFSTQQINDSINDKRGLLTTYQLFQLFFLIEDGLIDRNDIYKKMLNYGHINFVPSNIINIGKPSEILKNNYVAIILLKNINLSVNDYIFIKKDETYKKGKIVSIMKDNVSITNATNGEIGIELNIQIPKNSELFIKTDTQQKNAPDR